MALWGSLQVKFGLSYIAVIAAVLLLLNTYPLLAGEAGAGPGGAGIHHDKVGSGLLFCGGKPAYSLSSA